MYLEIKKNKSEVQLKQANEDQVKLIFHCKGWEYDVIKNVITNDFGFVLTEDDKADFDIIWHNTGLKASEIKKLKSYQKYNHFPGMYQLANKKNLGRNLMKMHKLHPKEYNFFPKTWVLPNDFPEFVKHTKVHEGQTYIVKPDMNSQGRGIFLTKNKDDINPRSNVVIQEYLEEPFLVDNLKFDMRLYVLVTSVDPLRIYLFDDGLVRFATVEYEKPTDENINNTYIHLTNYAINKNNENFVFNDEGMDKGHKRTLKSFWKSLNAMGIETDLIQEEIKDILVKTFLWVQPQLAHEYRSWLTDDVDGSSWFEILGFDVMLDENLDPSLIEVNHAPSFATDSNLDLNIKASLLKDSFKLLNMSVQRKLQYKKERNKIAQNRIFTGRKEIVTQEDKDRARKLHNITKHRYEVNNWGNFELLYPIVDDKKNILGDHSNDYYTIPKHVNRALGGIKKDSSDSTTDWSKSGAESGITLPPPSAPKLAQEKTKGEMLAEKYQGFIEDAFDEWEDFTNGYRFRTKYLMAEDDDSIKQSKEDLLNTRNPNKSRQTFQKTVRVSNRTGFDSSATRMEFHLKRQGKNFETPKQPKLTNITEGTKSRRVVYPKAQRQGQKFLNSVLSKYISKSIVVSPENEESKTSSIETGKHLLQSRPSHWLPVISNPKTLKEIQLKSRDLQYPKDKQPSSNKNSTPKLPKVL